MGLKSKVLVALSSLAIFLSPVFAQKIEEKPKEKTPFASIGFSIRKIELQPDEWCESIDNLARNLNLGGNKLPPLVYYEFNIEKYIGDYSIELIGSKAFPQRLRGGGDTNFYINDVLFAVVATSIDQKFYEENLTLNIWHNLQIKSSSISLGMGAGIFHKKGDIRFTFAQYDVVNDIRSLVGSCDVNSVYEGSGYYFNMNVASDWKLFGGFYLRPGVSYCVLGKKTIKKTEYHETSLNVDASLMDEREIDRKGAVSTSLGLEFKF